MYKRILVPLDGSDTSKRGLDEALKLARSLGATLYLLHVVDEHQFVRDNEVMAAVSEEYLDALRDSGGKVLAAAQATAQGAGVSCEKVLAENLAGNIAEIIVEQAEKLQADVVVMGTHGRRGVRRLVMGSDAEGVVRTSPVPVLLVRGDTESGSG